MKNKFDIAEIQDYIKNSSPNSAVYVGCDSHKTTKRGRKEVVFVTVVIVHIDQSKGAKVFSKMDILPEFPSNKERLLKEVELTINVATELVDVVDKRVFQLHLDLNPDAEHFSSTVVKEAIGWCRGMGFEDVVIKPDSFASHACADHYAVKLAN